MIYFSIIRKLIRPGFNDNHISDDIEGTKDEDINDEDNNLDKKT